MINDPHVHGDSPTNSDIHGHSPTGSDPAGGSLRRKTLVIAGALAVAIAIAAGLFLSRGAAEDEHDAIAKNFSPELKQLVSANEEDWLTAANFPEASDPAARLERAIAPISDAVDDRDSLLPDEALDSLMRTIHEHAAARSERSPARYLALCEAESELYEWIPREENAVMNTFMDYWNLGAGPEGTPQSALRSYWSYFYDEKGDRFTRSVSRRRGLASSSARCAPWTRATSSSLDTMRTMSSITGPVGWRSRARSSSAVRGGRSTMF